MCQTRVGWPICLLFAAESGSAHGRPAELATIPAVLTTT
jgi:hypothetical protein